MIKEFYQHQKVYSRKFDWLVFRDAYWEILWKITNNPKYLIKLMSTP